MVPADGERDLSDHDPDGRALAGGPLNVLFVASECAPLVKTGGLADVVGALPAALAAQGCRVRVLLPAYAGGAAGDGEPVLDLGELFGGAARVVAARAGGLDLLLLDAPHLFRRAGGPYQDEELRDWPDNHLRFAALCRAAARVGEGALADGWRPAVVHAHDWQAGLTPLYLSGVAGRPATVTTIHNVGFQGNFDGGARRTLDLPEAGFDITGYEFYGRVSFLKAGIVYADAITTVSPTYARELTDPEHGWGMQGLIAERAGRLHGILNGVDLNAWDPERDPAIRPFGIRRLPARQKNRQVLAEAFGLEPAGGPLFGVVSRLSWQKGIDLLLDALPRLIDEGGCLAVLGSGERELEGALRSAAARHPGRVGIRIGYDEAMARRVFAGCDALLVPSRFEPCGLTQLYALRYGALPVVARTGGLADTVIDANEAAMRAGVATGVQVPPGSAPALADGISRASALYGDRSAWQKMQRNGMRAPFGWDGSAARYRALYDALLAETRA